MVVIPLRTRDFWKFLKKNLHNDAETLRPPFTRVRSNFCTDKNLHGSTLRLHGTGGTGRIFERPRPSLHGSGQIVAREKTCTVQLAFTRNRRKWTIF